MQKESEEKYDVVIIGAGMSGLVCGCYLAKAGMKVLIAEQHTKPGGYCTSFERKGLTFDAAPHCFGSYRKDGTTRKIFADLGIDKKLRITRPDPTDIVMTPDYKISFWTDSDKTIEEFQTLFPKESNNIKHFFNFLLNPDLNALSRIRSWTFKKLLDNYFTNDNLKNILAAPLLGLGGLPPSMMSAFIGIQLFSEFLLDGGYYPYGGMRALPDALVERFREFGGKLLLSRPVKEIRVKDNKATGVILEKSSFIPSRFVISNCDARETFLKLLGKKIIGNEFYSKLLKMIPSISNFVLYLGLDKHFQSSLNPGTNLCFFPHDNVDNAYRIVLKGSIEDYGGYMLHISHDKSTVSATIPAPYKNKDYWKNCKHRFLKSSINRIEKYSFLHLSKHIIYNDAATPYTLFRYTRNYKGAAYGWASVPSQFGDPDFKRPPFVRNLYLTGHWTTQVLGISGVVYTGYNTATSLLKKYNSRNVS